METAVDGKVVVQDVEYTFTVSGSDSVGEKPEDVAQKARVVAEKLKQSEKRD